MSESNNKGNEVEKIVDALPPSLRPWVRVVPSLSELLRRVAVPGQIIIAILGLGFAFYHGWYWNKISTDLNHRIQTSLKARLDNTVWQHKGLAGYLLSDIDSSTSASNPGTGNFSTEITSTIQNIQQQINQQIEEGQKPPKNATGGGSQTKTNFDVKSVMNIKEDINQLGHNETRGNSFTIYDPDGIQHGTAVGQALVMSGVKFFLFIPATSIRREAETYAPFGSKTESDTSTKSKATPDPLEKALMHNPDIIRDLYLVQQLIDLLPTLDKGKINGKEVVQSYFITESGMILIRSSHKSNQGAFYNSLFNPYHHFTDRAYFWGAIEHKPIGDYQPLPFEYVSEPYVDLGGHGLVRTYSKDFKLANQRYGVLCVDVTEDELMNEVRNRLKALQADDELFGGVTEPSFGEVSVKIGDDGLKDMNPLPPDFKWFSQKLTENNKSDIIGKIAAEQDYKPTKDSILRYTIPLSANLEDGGRRVNLMWIRIDFNRLWQKQTWHLIYMCLGIGLTLMFTLNLFQDYFLLKKEIADLAKSIDRVMADSENAYLRLDSENKFVNVNKKFITLLGYGNDSKLVGEGKTFRSILAPESQEYYDAVLKKSESGLPTGVYPLTLLNEKEEKVEVRVHGERIVFPAFRRKKYPHRFGIILYDSKEESNQSK
jgi:PAS domain-containing protein